MPRAGNARRFAHIGGREAETAIALEHDPVVRRLVIAVMLQVVAVETMQLLDEIEERVVLRIAEQRLG
jgi:hypothetical protein